MLTNEPKVEAASSRFQGLGHLHVEAILWGIQIKKSQSLSFTDEGHDSFNHIVSSKKRKPCELIV